jgi:hypothetical protein
VGGSVCCHKGCGGRFGKEDLLRYGDYLIVDDNYGWRRHTIEIHNLRMLDPRLVSILRSLLDNYPDWEVIIAVDIPGTETTWPRMGLTIRKREIIDGLRREFLSVEYRSLHFENSRAGTGFD